MHTSSIMVTGFGMIYRHAGIIIVTSWNVERTTKLSFSFECLYFNIIWFLSNYQRKRSVKILPCSIIKNTTSSWQMQNPTMEHCGALAT